MFSKKFISAVMSMCMLAGVATTSVVKANTFSNMGTQGEDAQNYSQNSYSKYGGPIDLSIANEEKVIDMLKKEGKIAKNASYEEANKIYLEFMKEKAKANAKVPVSKMDKELKAKQNQKVQKYNFEQSKPDTNPKEVKVLTVLVDYSDYKHNSITSEESDMYYKDYTKEHYEDMIFGDNGYKGPNGENLISMKQYYKEQSGGSLNVTGKVAGWYSLPKTAAEYDENAKDAVKDALNAVSNDPNINLADFDKEDRYDIDGDGNYNEPDGLIDHLMILHAGMGEEAGGGSLGSTAIWSHRSNLMGVYAIPNTNTNVPYWGGALGAYDYTIEPEDGAAGVFAHEFGHDLGLPDEYDTNYTSASGEPISYWSIMSSGSWAGKIPGTEPTGFSPYAKEFFQGVYGGNWQKQINVDYNNISQAGVRVNLKQASDQGQTVRISLPDKKTVVNTPTSGQYSYWGGKGQDGAPILTNMASTIDLTKTTNPILNFKTWYDIEEGWDYASIQVRPVGTTEWTYIKGNITTTEGVDEREVVVPHGITGTSNGWVDGIFDLSAFAGKNVEVKFEYQTDSYTFGNGFYVDDIKLMDGNKVIFSDDAEGTSTFTMSGFEKNTGSVVSHHYYLVEWRNHSGVDKGLANVTTLGQQIPYDPGMLVWYVDEFYTDNWTGVHPGNGYLGIVDADQHSVLWRWSDPNEAPALASGKYQMHDAAFSKNKETKLNVDLTNFYGRTAVDEYTFTEPNFDDSKNYSNPQIPSLGRNIPKYGIKIQIANQAADNSSATIIIKK